ncbi:LysE family translocator [Oleispirillum naphthae]|uniref:LysE family translocator n=1 Tax=Oleispirillum naphthae TaxID=2838853 RepID=UPI0030822555
MITLPFLLTALVVVLMPGTGVIYTVSCGLLHGRRAAVVAAFGCTLGIVPHLAACLLGLAAVLHAGAMAFQAMRLLGAVYLGFLAWSLWRDAAEPVSLAAPAARRGHPALRGIALNLLNPKLTLFFFAFLPQFVDPATDPARQMLLLGAVFMAMTFAVFVVYGLCAAAARQKVLESPAVLSWLKRGFAAAFAALGLRLAFGE